MGRLLQLTIIPVLLLCGGCGVCREEIQSQSASPDGKWTAKTTTRACTGSSSQMTGVYLQTANVPPRKLGEVVFIAKNQHPVKVAWTSATSVLITCMTCGSDMKIHRTEAHGIRIAYDVH